MKCRFYKQETKRKFDIKFICFEKEPKYVEASQQRLEDERAQMKLFN